MNAKPILFAASAGLVLGLAAQAAGQGGADSALGAPARAKVGAPAAAATVKAGSGGGVANVGQQAPARSAELEAAIAAHDINKALTLGATAKDIAQLLQAKYPDRNINPDSAVFVRGPQGQFAIGYTPNPPAVGRALWIDIEFRGYIPPGGTDSLPSSDEVFGPLPPPPPPTPQQQVIADRAIAGAPAQETAAAMMASQPPPPAGAPAWDMASAQYIRGPDGALAIAIRSVDGEGFRVSRVPGGDTFPGLANLPTMEQILPPRPAP